MSSNLFSDVSNFIAIDYDVVKRTTVDGLAIDSHARLLFYTNSANDIIRKLNMNDYDDYEDVISTKMSDPRTIVLDITVRMIYWTDWGEITIERATYEGTEREILLTKSHLFLPNGQAIDFQECPLLPAPTNGSVNYSNSNQYGSTAYFNCDNNSYLIGNSVLICQTDGSWNGRIPECKEIDLPQSDFLLVADIHGFSVINLVNGDLGEHVFHNLSADVSNMVAIDFDVVKKRVYFSDVTTKRILSSTIDGEDVRVEIINNKTATVDGLAIDSHARLLFYTDFGNDIIRKLNMNDYDDYEDVISTNISKPRTIVLDTTERMIYWTDWGVRTIERATYEGTEREILFTEKHLYLPNGLAIDFQVGHIYWVDAGYDYIGSANLDGTNVTTVATLGRIHTFGIALYKDMYIISDWDTNSVIPVLKNLSVGNIQTGFERPCDIHVYLWQECPLLPAPTNGSVNYSNSNQYGSTAYFNCDNNSYLIGNSVSICLTDGSWNGSLPECKEKACNKDDECISSGAKCTGGVCSCTKLYDSTSDRCDTTALEEESQKPSELTGEQKLLKELFRQYNKLARPQGSPLNVSHFIELRRIVGLYSKKYVVGLDIWDNQEWTDDRLVWNPIAYSNITLLHVPSDVIWTPDIVVVNSADEYPRASQPTGNIIIHSDGSIVYYQSKLIYAYGCTTAADVECNVKFSSWTYNGFELNLINTMDEVATNYEFEGSFTSRKFLSGNVTRNVQRYACCPEPYVSLTYKLKLKLKTT